MGRARHFEAARTFRAQSLRPGRGQVQGLRGVESEKREGSTCVLWTDSMRVIVETVIRAPRAAST